jgi:hypothetical protein
MDLHWHTSLMLLSQRIKKRRDVAHTENLQCHEGGSTIEGLEEGRCTATIRNHDSYQEQMPALKKKANNRRQEITTICNPI